MSGFRFLFLLFVFVVANTTQAAIAQTDGDDPQSNQTANTDNQSIDDAPKFTSKSTTILVAYCLFIVGGSMLGGWLPSVINLTHNRMQLLISLIGGLMLGIGLFHMLPHALEQFNLNNKPGEHVHVHQAMTWMMLGLVFMFFLLRMFHFHQHELPDAHDHAAHDHDHDCTHPHSAAKTDVNKLSWVGVFIGLAIHTFVDGLALGASVQSDLIHADLWLPFGIGTFLAIFLHKPLDAVSITSLMKATGCGTGLRMTVNVCFSLMCPLGAALFLFGVSQSGASQTQIIGCALAFSAGVFVCISLSDLLPEMEFHSHSRVPLSIALIVGIAIAWGIAQLEPHSKTHRVSMPQPSVSSPMV